jgi:DNA-binding NtrC family response regulator
LQVDVRLVCATNRNLRLEVEAGRFREDLFFRICVIPVTVPPLRERNGDILELAEHFLGQSCVENGRPPMRLEPEARSLLLQHPWPGNVRELRNLMERLAIMHPDDLISAAALRATLQPAAGGVPPEGRRQEQAQGGPERQASPAGAEPEQQPGAGPGPLKGRLEEAERAILEEVLQRWGWNVTRAAEELGIDRATLHRRARRLGVERPRPDDAGR